MSMYSDEFRAKLQAEIEAMDADPMYAGPRPYSKCPPIRALQAIGDWYLGPAVTIAAIVGRSGRDVVVDPLVRHAGQNASDWTC